MIDFANIPHDTLTAWIFWLEIIIILLLILVLLKGLIWDWD